jgi:predicted protein tyrosine phosphatase
MVMEQRYKSRIQEMFRDHPDFPRIVSLDIPDDYEYLDKDLIKLIREGTEFHLKNEFNIE